MAQTNELQKLFITANESVLSGNYTDAVIKLQHIYENVTSQQDKAIIAQSLSTSYIALGQYKEAESLLLLTRNTIGNEELKKSSEYRELTNLLSLVYLEMRNYEKANSYIQEAKNLYEENLDFGEGYVRCLSIMAGLQTELGYTTLGRMLIDVAVRQAKANYENLKNGTVPDAYNLFSGQGQEGAYRHQVSIYAQLLSNAAATYERMGYYGDAVSLLKEAISISNSVGIELTFCYGNLASLYLDKSKYRDAVENYKKALDLATSPSAFDELSMTLSLAKLFAGDKDVADITLRHSDILKSHQQYAFTFLSESERQSYWENSGHNIPLQNYIYQEKGSANHFGAIYNNLLYSKGLLLRTTNDIYNKVIETGDSQMLELYRYLLQTKSAMMSETNPVRINSLQIRCDSIDKELVGVYGSSTTEITWKDVQAKLNDRDIAIEFYCIPNIILTESYADSKTDGSIYCAATIRKGYKTPHITKLISSKDIETLLSGTPYESSELFNAIWKKLYSELNGIKNIYFSADRDLHKVALESLIDENHQTANSLWNIYRLSSTRELVANKKNIQRKHYALFGGLNYSADVEDIEDCLKREGIRSISTYLNRTDSVPLTRAGMRYLPGTKVEVESIQKELNDKEAIDCYVYTGLSGTEELLKSLSGKDINVIHLATHGYYWTKSEAETQKGIGSLMQNRDKNTSALLRSGILMTGANHALRGETIPYNIEDGIATAQELSNLDYRNVDLVVLSACQSALGEVNGEGVYGLQRGLKLAGVQSLLMTLWPVDDQATQMLMVEFYKNLISGNSKALALKKAQEYIKVQPGFESPEYWAGFILLDALN